MRLILHKKCLNVRREISPILMALGRPTQASALSKCASAAYESHEIEPKGINMEKFLVGTGEDLHSDIVGKFRVTASSIGWPRYDPRHSIWRAFWRCEHGCNSNVYASTRLLDSLACSFSFDKVSASALRWEGQLTVYHQGPDGPCYRCLYPKPPNPNFVTNCSDGGVLGVGKSFQAE